MATDHTTEALVRRAQAGDQAALESLLTRYVPALTRWARGRLPVWARSLIDTDDLVQDTVLQTIRRLDAFQPRGAGAFQAYLRQAVINRVRNEVRNATRRPPAGPLDSSAVSDAPSPLEMAITREGLNRYEHALQQLSESERGAVIARLELGLSYQEIAESQGRPSSDAARVAVGRALVRLAEHLEAAKRSQP